jgi:nucleotide-binding universal stress UspA family protein
MHRFHTIVVPVDFSDTSPDTLAATLELARGEHHRIHLIHVIQDVFHSLGVAEFAGVDWNEVQRGWLEEARQQLVGLAAVSNLDPETVTIDVPVGQPAAEIVRYANDHRADAIVLGSHGHGLVRRFMLGAVAERVLRQASCPVMLVPHRTLRLTPSEMKAASGVAS